MLETYILQEMEFIDYVDVHVFFLCTGLAKSTIGDPLTLRGVNYIVLKMKNTI